MAARAQLPTRALQAALVATGLVVGVLAGVEPKLAVAATLALVLVTVVMADLAVGVAAFAAISFLDVLPLGGAFVSFTKVAGLLVAVSWLAVLATRRDATNEFFSAHPGLSYVFVIFLGWVAMSGVWAEDPSVTMKSFYRFGLNIMLFPIVFTAVRTRRHAEWVLAAFLAGAVTSAVYGIVAPAPASTFGGVERIGGAGVDPNQEAAILVAALTIAAAFIAGSRRSSRWRLAAIPVIPLCLAGVLLSFSRGGLIALTIALVAAVFVGGRWRLLAAVLVVVVALSSVAFFAYVATPVERARVTETGGGSGRSSIWAVGWRMVEAHPLNGVGAYNFPISSVHYLLKPGAIKRSDFIIDKPKVAHNMYLDVLAELGIVGAVLFLTLIGASLRYTVRAARRFQQAGDRSGELLSRAVVVAVLALLAAFFFLSEQYNKQLWILLALGPALAAVAERELEARRQASVT